MMRVVEQRNSYTAMSSGYKSIHRSLRVAMVAHTTIHTMRVQQWLSSSGTDCESYASIRQFQGAAINNVFDALIIDCNVSGGIVDSDFLRWIRDAISTNIPVLVISHSDVEQDIVTALYAGADVFLNKPLRRNEFLARLQALLRRAYAEPELLELNPYTIDLRNRQIRNQGVVVNLTNLEYELTVFLFRHRGVVLSREKLLESVWRIPASIDARTVDTHICRLRMKLKIKGGHRWILSAVYQRGYCLRRQMIPSRDRPAAVAEQRQASLVVC